MPIRAQPVRKRESTFYYYYRRRVGSLYAVLQTELELLHSLPVGVVETTLLIHPNALNDFLDYNDFLSVAGDHAQIRITRQKGEPAVLISLADFESWQETAYLLHSPECCAPAPWNCPGEVWQDPQKEAHQVVVKWSDDAWADYLHWNGKDQQILKRINRLVAVIESGPFRGIGKPESLRHGLAGRWCDYQRVPRRRLAGNGNMIASLRCGVS